jgi:hypothetical protein
LLPIPVASVAHAPQLDAPWLVKLRDLIRKEDARAIELALAILAEYETSLLKLETFQDFFDCLNLSDAIRSEEPAGADAFVGNLLKRFEQQPKR